MDTCNWCKAVIKYGHEEDCPIEEIERLRAEVRHERNLRRIAEQTVMAAAINDAKKLRAELERERADAVPPEVLHLLRFMCATWVEVDDWAYEHVGGKALMHYPVIQGTRNQILLRRIGRQPFDQTAIRTAMTYMQEAALSGGEEKHERL